jgi:hypothetical protein
VQGDVAGQTLRDRGQQRIREERPWLRHPETEPDLANAPTPSQLLPPQHNPLTVPPQPVSSGRHATDGIYSLKFMAPGLQNRKVEVRRARCGRARVRRHPCVG